MVALRYLINVRASVADETTLLVDYMSTVLKKYRVIAFYSDNMAGLSGFAALQNSLKFLGVNLIASASYNVTSPNIDASLSSLQEAVNRVNQQPEVIFLYGSHTVSFNSSILALGPLPTHFSAASRRLY